MKRVLIFFGQHAHWKNMCDKDSLLIYLHDCIDDVISINELNILKFYLNNDGRENKNYILPIKIEHIHNLNNANIKSLIDVNSNALVILSDKKLFVDYVSKNNLEKYLPKIYSKQCNREGISLVVIKPRDSAYSIGIRLEPICNVKDDDFENNVIQEYIHESMEFAGYFVADKGTITHAYAYVGNYGDKTFIKCMGGVYDNVPQQRIDLDIHLISAFEEFLKPCSYTGTCCFDFKIKNNRLYVFEINPRLGGSLDLPHNKQDLANIIRNMMQIQDANL